MRNYIVTFIVPVLLIAGGCGSETGSEPSETPSLASESVEQYPLRGVVEAKDESANALTVRHEDVQGLMPGMTMSFRVEGANVSSLPGVGQGVEATLNVAGPDYWLTEVKAADIPASLAQTSTDATSTTGDADAGADSTANAAETGTATR